MLSKLRSLLARPAESAVAAPAPAMPELPAEVASDGLPAFSLRTHLRDDDGFPALDWQAVHAWASSAATRRWRRAPGRSASGPGWNT